MIVTRAFPSDNCIKKHKREASISISIFFFLAFPVRLPLAAVGDGRNHGDVLLQSEGGVQGAVPRVDQRERAEACTINSAVSIKTAK